MLIYKQEEGSVVQPGIGYSWNLFELFFGISTGRDRVAWIGSTIKHGLKGIRISQHCGGFYLHKSSGRPWQRTEG